MLTRRTAVAGLLAGSAIAASGALAQEFPSRLVKIIEFGEHPSVSSLVIGEVVMAHVRDEFWANGELQSAKMKAIGRLLEPYCRTNEIFEFNVEYTL